MSDSLEPLSPSKAKEMYLRERQNEASAETIKAHHYRLKQFVSWCEDEGIENLNTLTGRDLHEYRVKRREDDDLAKATMKGQLATLRRFLRFCASVNGVSPNLDEKIILPTTTKDDARDEMLEPERAKEILGFLARFKYASYPHTLLATLWSTGIRIGAAHSVDVQDFDADDQVLELRHRPDEGTRLKNGVGGERYVALNDSVSAIIEDWIVNNRHDVVDDHGRDPLFTSTHGRPHKTSMRAVVYRYTRPCIYSNDCPHDRDPQECDAREASNAYDCPSSLSPHPVRRGSITHHLQADVPDRVVSDRMDVSLDVLDRHYDQRTEKDKVETRREFLDNI